MLHNSCPNTYVSVCSIDISKISFSGIFIFHFNPLDKGATPCGLAQKTTIIFDILDILAQDEVNIQLQISNDGCTAHGACDHK